MNELSFSERRKMVFPTLECEAGCYGYPKVVQKVVDGKTIQQVEFIVQDPTAEQDYTVDDFALQNLLAAGVKPKELQYNASQIGIAMDFEKVVESKN